MSYLLLVDFKIMGNRAFVINISHLIVQTIMHQTMTS